MASDPLRPAAAGDSAEGEVRRARWRRLPAWLLPSYGDLLVVALFGLLLSLPPYDTDVWWHLRTGEWILAEGRVPRVDGFSFTVAGRPWIAHEWLAEIGMALAFRLAGLEAMAVLQAALLAIVLAVLYRHMRADGVPSLAALPVLVVAMFLLLPAAHPRPYLLTLVGLAVLLFALRARRSAPSPGAAAAGARGPGPWERGPSMRVLVPFVAVLFALWANVHGGFALGLGAIGLVAVGETLRRRTIAFDMLGLLAIAALASMLNPYGPRLLAYPLQYRAGSIHYALITEWASLDFHEPFAWLVVGFLATTTVLLSARRAPGWHVDACLLAAFGAMALLSVRNIPLLAVVGTPILARQIVAGRQRRIGTEAGERPPYGPHGGSGPLGLWPGVARKLRWLAGLDAGTSGVPLTLLALVVSVGGILRGPSSPEAFDPALWPASAGWALPYTAATQLVDGMSGPAPDDLLNDYAWGGYLIWSVWPEQRVFIDGRADLYGEEILRDYADMVRLAPNWAALLEEYGIRRVLLPPDTALVEALRLVPEWTVAYEDEVSVLLRR